MKAYWESGCIAPRIRDLNTRRKWVVRFTARPFYSQGKSPWYPLDRRLSRPQSRSGLGDEEKTSQPLPGIKPPIIQPVVQRCTTELYRLLFPSSSSTKNAYAFLFFPMRATCPGHLILHGLVTIILHVQIMMLLIMQLSPASCCFSSL
jgi:hypothetical protein